MISAAFPYQKRHRRVLDREMAYVEVERATPSCCCTAISPRHISGAAFCRTLREGGRCIPRPADSEKLPNSGPGS
jgi:haloalkane dehalogenase